MPPVGDKGDIVMFTGVPFFVTVTVAPAKSVRVDCTDQDVKPSAKGDGKYPADGHGVRSVVALGRFVVQFRAYSDSAQRFEPEPIWVVSGSRTHWRWPTAAPFEESESFM